MAQILSAELRGYLTCCSDGNRIPVEEIPPLPKYLFQGSLPSPTTRFEMMIDYMTGQSDSSTIESNFGVGIAGIQEVQISYIEDNIVTTENIFVDLGFRPSPIHMHPEVTWELKISLPEEELLVISGEWLFTELID